MVFQTDQAAGFWYATAGTILFSMVRQRNGAAEEVTAACSLHRSLFSDLLPGPIGQDLLPASEFN